VPGTPGHGTRGDEMARRGAQGSCKRLRRTYMGSDGRPAMPSAAAGGLWLQQGLYSTVPSCARVKGAAVPRTGKRQAACCIRRLESASVRLCEAAPGPPPEHTTPRQQEDSGQGPPVGALGLALAPSSGVLCCC
jgi:hypothetical protein